MDRTGVYFVENVICVLPVLVSHHQRPEGEVFEKAETGATGVEKVVQIGLATQEITVGSLSCGNYRIRNGFAGQEGRKLCGSAGGPGSDLQEVVVQRFSSMTGVASIHRELLAGVVIVDSGSAVPGLLKVKCRAARKMCGARKSERHLVRAGEQSDLIGIDVIADGIAIIQAQVRSLFDKNFLELMCGDDVEFTQLPWTSKSNFIGAKLVERAAVGFGCIGVRDGELVGDTLQENIECGRAHRLSGEIVPLLRPGMQLTAVGFLDAVFENDGKGLRTTAARRIYGAKDESSFAGITTTAVNEAAAQVNPVDDGKEKERRLGQVELAVGEFGPTVDEALHSGTLSDGKSINGLRDGIGVQPISSAVTQIRPRKVT